MRLLSLTFVLFLASLPSFAQLKNEAVDTVDLQKYQGTWYSLYSIPTMFDSGSRETAGKYTWNKDGYFDVVTTYKKPKSNAVHSVNSKVFQVEDTGNAEMKAQFIWPYKIDYWVIELASDYSYVVVGHPDHKFLFIMSRHKSISPQLYQAIIKRCKAKGYDVSKLTAQYNS